MRLETVSVPARAEPEPATDSAAAPAYGALDIGTNSCRLLIARSDDPVAAGPAPEFHVIDAYSRVVCLGEGLEANGTLSEAAMDRALAALRICAGKLRHHKVDGVRAVATEACRRAANRLDFCRRVRRETGIRLDIISEAEEVELALAGCLPLLEPARRHALVFDIGGGSTQVSWLELKRQDGPETAADPVRLRAWQSIPFGVVGMRERYGGDSVSKSAFESMVGEVRAALKPFEKAHGLETRARAGQLQMLGTSGTATTLVGVHQRLRRYRRDLVDGKHLRRDTALALVRRIAGMSLRDRARIPSIGQDRARYVIGGCAILEAICRTWPVNALRVADRGLREGILHNLMRAGPTGAIQRTSDVSGGS